MEDKLYEFSEDLIMLGEGYCARISQNGGMCVHE